jgi:hypothetical protein
VSCLRLALLLAALCFPAAAAAKGTCLERCGESLVRCTGRCNFDAKCMGRCQDQLDTCNDACGKSGDTQVPMPKRCTDAKGRSVSCEAFSTPSQKTPKPPRK